MYIKKRIECVENIDPYDSYSPDNSLGIIDAMERILSEEERRVVILHVLWKYKHKEIAQMLGVPTGTVTSKYKRAIEKIRKEI